MTADTAAQIAGRRAADGRVVLAATILASGMVFIDGAVVNVALPALRGAFDAGTAGLQWVVESYLLTLTALMLAGGALGDRLGRRRVFTVGVVLFAAASAACGLAGSVAQLALARAAQGIGGALLVPGSLAIITAFFAERERGRAIGTWSAWSAVTVALAPLLGGWLVDAAGWRWIFLINLPLAALVLALTLWRVPESRDGSAGGRIDWAGSLAATAGLGLLVLALIESGRLGFGHPMVWGGVLAGAAGLALFLGIEARVTHPMLPLGLFRDRTFSGANGLTLALYGALSAALFFLPLHLIEVLGYSALQAGAALLPFVVLISTLSRAAGALADRLGPRLPLTLGSAIVALGCTWLAWPGLASAYWTGFFPATVLMGLGMALVVAPLTTAVMNAAPPDRSGIASAINNAVSRVAALLAIALVGALAVARFRDALPAALAAALGPEALKLGAAMPPPGLAPEEVGPAAAAIAAAGLASFRLVALACAALSLASAAIAWTTISGARSGRSPGQRSGASP